MRHVLPLLLLTACDDKGGESASTGDVVYYRDIKPITDAYCTSCHYDGGIGPFPLTTYDEVSAMAGAANAAIQGGRMPPWKADNNCNSYLYNTSLNDDQKALFDAWASDGAPEGDPADEGAPVPLEESTLSRSDVTFTLEEPYTPLEEPDDYRRFVFDWEEGDAYVTGMQVDPDEARVVHHVIAYQLSPAELAEARTLDAEEDGYGYTCYGGPGVTGGANWLGAWVPGAAGRDFPEGTGIAMEEGGGLAVQIHYNTDTAGPLPDQTSLSFKVDDAVDAPARVVKILDTGWPLGTTDMTIAAGDPDATASYTLTAPADLLVYQVGLHMHGLGSSASLKTTSASGDETCLMSIPDWDFHWQGSVLLEEPTLIAAGDTVSIECHWDNSEGTSDVGWGEGTADEMCLGTAYITLP